MESLLIAINAVMPFLLYMAFGLFISKMGLTDDNFLKKLNQMVFKAFFPVMMFYNMYTKERGITINISVVMVALISLGLLMLVLLLTVPRLVDENGKKGVIIQATYRSNFVLFAVPLMENIYGKDGAVIATMLVAIVVPVYNILAVIVLEYYGENKKNSGLASMVKSVITNPIISGTIVGLLFFSLNIPLPACVVKPISQFAGMTTPLALFILGGTLKFGSMVKNMKYLIPSIAAKLLVLPGIIIAVSSLCGISAIERFLLFCMYGTPVAAASFPMAQSMGCDGELAGEFVVLSTTISVITIFLWVLLLGNMGMI